MKKRTLIFIIIILMIIVSLLFYMTRGHYETVTYEMGDIIDETHQISSFHVRAYLDTQIIYISNVKSGAYCIRIYYVPENDINYKLINSSPEEIGELYIMNGYKGIAINENLDLVYEAEISESGEYVIDTQDLKKGTYLIERYGTGDVDITFTQSFEYTNYNLSSYLTNFPYFTRLPEPQTMKLYVFSLVFALMGNLQGKVFSYCPTTLSNSLAEVRFASLVAWA